MYSTSLIFLPQQVHFALSVLMNLIVFILFPFWLHLQYTESVDCLQTHIQIILGLLNVNCLYILVMWKNGTEKGATLLRSHLSCSAIILTDLSIATDLCIATHFRIAMDFRNVRKYRIATDYRIIIDPCVAIDFCIVMDFRIVINHSIITDFRIAIDLRLATDYRPTTDSRIVIDLCILIYTTIPIPG